MLKIIWSHDDTEIGKIKNTFGKGRTMDENQVSECNEALENKYLK